MSNDKNNVTDTDERKDTDAVKDNDKDALTGADATENEAAENDDVEAAAEETAGTEESFEENDSTDGNDSSGEAAANGYDEAPESVDFSVSFDEDEAIIDIAPVADATDADDAGDADGELADDVAEDIAEAEVDDEIDGGEAIVAEEADDVAETGDDTADAGDRATEDTVAAENAKRVNETLRARKGAKKDALSGHATARDHETATAVSRKLDHELTGRRGRKLDNSVFRAYPLFAFTNVSLVDKKSGAEVLENVNFRCDAGNSYALLIPNDAPMMHTMLLSVMTGMTLPTTGHVMTKSTSLAEIAPLEIRGYRIGLMTQQFSFRPDLDAEDNLLYAMDASNRNFLQPKPVVARELLQHVGFGADSVDDNGEPLPVATKGVKLAKLSVMDQHRVAVARAISRDPDIVIADEPTATLDEQDGAEIIKLLKKQVRARTKKRTVIVVTSSEDVARQVGNIIDLRY
ncbi:ATP-binding cassette domain-containing protein [Bifidobacterium choloepi]|uniref:ATP-binding cassette domain-containing protein n=1 Tax=Bifidobacterium choloepi TaxID=2614131 RepID=A0A6I5N493_9BIFI|nr:ATP-binding cassette domain-containing protein [Bifidobacterium choloepi]NEG70499.1 ATP-binding cassette domain-containing protein [Bifidobacterium choloepi]